MLTARFFNAAGEPGDAVQLPEELFDGVVHEAALHLTIKAYLANQRQGNASTKTRANLGWLGNTCSSTTTGANRHLAHE